MTHPNLFTQPAEELCDTFKTGAELMQQGIDLAEKHANQVIEKWTDRAYAKGIEYLTQLPQGTKFMGEDFRVWAIENGLEKPPHDRAFGGTMQRLAFNGLIIKAGIDKVKTPSNHCAFAAVWQVKAA
jgi:hypothetical protein